MIEIKNCSKVFGKIQAVNKVTMDIGTGGFWTDRLQRCGKKYSASYHGRDHPSGQRRGADG
mgnify:FL=1